MPNAKGSKVSEVALKDTDLSAGEASSRAAVLKRLRTNDMVFRLVTRSAALTVLLTNTLPTNMTFISSAPSQGSCARNGWLIRASMASG